MVGRTAWLTRRPRGQVEHARPLVARESGASGRISSGAARSPARGGPPGTPPAPPAPPFN